MKENTKLNWSFWLSLLAFVISIVALAVFFCKVKPYCVVTIDTYIGVIAGFIGIAVTLVIGFQIYSFISIKDKVKEIMLLKDELVTTKGNLSLIKNEISELEKKFQGEINWSIGDIYCENGNNIEAFKRFQQAICYFADLDSQKELLSFYIKRLDACCREFKGVVENEQILLKSQLLILQHNNLSLQKRKYYWVIKEAYEEVYKNFIVKLHSLIND